MVTFKIFFENSDDVIHLSPRTIYNFYFLYTYLQTRGVDQYSKFLIDEFAQNIKKLYMSVFTNLIRKQLKKYSDRKRVDADFTIYDNPTPIDLKNLMDKTFRSDMKRRNDRWVDLSDWVVKLSTANLTKDILFIIDRINNTTHNTQEIILSKFDNAGVLMQVFDNCHDFKSLGEFRPYINKEYAKLL